MPTLIERVKTAYKAFWGSGNWVDSNHYPGGYNRFLYTPGTNFDYAREVGDARTNSIIQAVLNKVMLAWPESYPCVKQKKGDKKVEVEDHPLSAILNSPSQSFAYDDTVLWGATIQDFFPFGNAYWGINRERLTGYIGEFVPIPEYGILPKRNEGSRNPGPDYYETSLDGKTEKHRPEDIVHFRFGRSLTNDLLGIAFPASGVREVYGDNEAANYINSGLKNKGAAWIIASPKDKEGYFNDPHGLKDRLEAHTTGDNRHRALVLNGATDIVFPPSMKDTGPDALRRTPETRLCALLGFSPMWVGLMAGLERSTYSNMEEAARDAWYTIVAVQRMMGRQLTLQVLRRPGNFQSNWHNKKYTAGFDYSEVRALQPNKIEEWKRVGEACSVHKILTKDEARAEIGYDPLTPEQAEELAEPEPQEQKPNTTPKNGNGKHLIAAN